MSETFPINIWINEERFDKLQKAGLESLTVEMLAGLKVLRLINEPTADQTGCIFNISNGRDHGSGYRGNRDACNWQNPHRPCSCCLVFVTAFRLLLPSGCQVDRRLSGTTTSSRQHCRVTHRAGGRGIRRIVGATTGTSKSGGSRRQFRSTLARYESLSTREGQESVPFGRKCV